MPIIIIILYGGPGIIIKYAQLDMVSFPDCSTVATLDQSGNEAILELLACYRLSEVVFLGC